MCLYTQAFNWFISALMMITTSSCLPWWANHCGCQGLATHPDVHPELWCVSASCMMWVYRTELGLVYFCASSQRSDCLLKCAVAKVNKQWLRCCVVDWKGNDPVCLFACTVVSACMGYRLYRWGYTPVPASFLWRFLLAASPPADLSVLLSLQGYEVTHRRAHLGPHSLFQLFSSLCCSVSFHLFSFFPAHHTLLTPFSSPNKQNNKLSPFIYLFI